MDSSTGVTAPTDPVASSAGRGLARNPAAILGRLGVGPMSAIAVVSLAGFGLWLLSGVAGPEARQQVSNLYPIGLELIAAAIAGLCALRAQGWTRVAWGLIAGSYLLYMLGDSTWSYLELVENSSPFPSLADAFYLAFTPPLLAGLLALPAPKRRRSEWARLGLDVLTVTIAGSMAVWYLVISPTLADATGSWLTTALSVAYPASDLVLLFGVATVIVRGLDPSRRVGLVCMALGASAFMAADIGFARLSLTGGYEAGSWPDFGWSFAFVSFIVAADWELHHPAGLGRRTMRVPPPTINPLPYLAIASGFGLLLHVGFTNAGSTVRTLLVLVGALTVTVVIRQVTALRDNTRMTAELQRLATTDSLTSLANRGHLLRLAEHHFVEARRAGTHLAVIYVDVDHFKSINDIHGHAAGDAVLMWLGNELDDATRGSDLVGRFGGDEFIIVAPGLDATNALSLANRIERSVATAVSPVTDGPKRITLSLGVATADRCADLDDLLARADAALYEAKRAGRSRASLTNA